MDAVDRTSLDEQGSTAIVFYAGDAGSHHGKGLHNTLHGPFADGFVSCESDVKVLAAEDSGYEARGGAAVSAVQDFPWRVQSVQAAAMDQHLPALVFYINAHFLKTCNGRQAVRSLEKIVYLRKPLCNGAEHDGPMGDGFISGNPDFAL